MRLKSQSRRRHTYLAQLVGGGASATVRALLYPSVCRDSSSPPSPIAIVGGASKRAEACGRDMAGRYDGGNPFEEEEDVNPFSVRSQSPSYATPSLSLSHSAIAPDAADLVSFSSPWARLGVRLRSDLTRGRSHLIFSPIRPISPSRTLLVLGDSRWTDEALVPKPSCMPS